MKKLLRLLTFYDWLLALVLLLTAGGLFVGLGRAAAQPPGAYVSLSRDGVPLAQYSLAEDRRLELTWQGHHNLLVISQGQAWIEAADCPDQYCVRQGPVSRRRESLVCLPARLVVTVQGGEAGQLDAISQ